MGEFCLLVVNYNTYEQTIALVRQALRIVDHSVVVVDNCSSNDSLLKLQEAFRADDRVHVLANTSNTGYGQGNNVGLRFVKTELGQVEYVVVSNNDIVLTRAYRSFLLYCRDVFCSDDRTLAIGPTIRGLDGGYQSPKAATGPGRDLFYSLLYPISYLVEMLRQRIFVSRRHPSKVFSLNGSFWCFDLKNFEKIGFFDERTFLYWEEEIVGIRAKRHCMPIVYDPRAAFVHKHGGTVSKEVTLRNYYRIFSASHEVLLSYFPLSLRWLGHCAFRSRVALAYAMKCAIEGARRLRNAV
jgi:GT2 family glycosyltransferase